MPPFESEFFKSQPFRLILENTSDIITVIDRGGVIHYESPSLERVLGYRPEELVGRNLDEFIHLDDLATVRGIIDEAVGQVGTPSCAEFRFRHNDGSWRYLEAVGKALLVGQSLFGVVTSRDYTYRKQIEQKLRTSEENLRLIAENMVDMVSLVNLRGSRLYVSPAHTRILGYKPEELIGKPVTNFVHAEDLDRVNAAIERTRQTRTMERVEYRCKHSDGHYVWLESTGQMVLDQTGTPTGAVLTGRDITERKQAEEELKRRANEFAALYETACELAGVEDVPTLLGTIIARALALLGVPSGCIFLYDPVRRDLEIAAAQGIELGVGTHFQLGEGMAGRVAQTREILVVDDYRAWPNRSPQMFNTPISASVSVPMLYGGELIGVLDANEVGDTERRFTEQDARLMSLFASQAAAAVHDARLLEETRARAQRLELVYDAGLALNSVLEHHVQLESLFQIAMTALHGDRADFFRGDRMTGEMSFELGLGHPPEVAEKLHGVSFSYGEPRGINGWVFHSRLPQYVPDVFAESRYLMLDPDVRSGLYVPVEHEQQPLGVLSLLSTRPNAFSAEDLRLLVLFANQAAVAMENARLFKETHQRLAELEAINRVSTALREARTLDEMLPRLLDETLSVLGTTAGTIWLVTAAGESRIKELSRGWFERVGEYPPEENEGLAFHILKTGQPYVTVDLKTDPVVRNSVREAIPENWSGACIPIRTTTETVGALLIAVPRPRLLNDDEIHLLSTLAEIAGNAIHRASLHERTERQVRHLAALHTIDMTITASVDLNLSLNVILQLVTKELAIDAADVLLLEPKTQVLEFAAALGFRTDSLRYTRLRLGEGLAGRAAMERHINIVPDLSADVDGLARSKSLPSEQFVAYCAAPLSAKGQIKGVLELFHRTHLNPEPAWLNLLETMATQLAIAIDNSELFIGLQRSNTELALAYDTTLEGWSRAMDLRDKETEGHTQRVTEMTVRLARALDVQEEELVHIRRGALLHDIGKIGVPDAILLKPGPLTEEEWSIMRKHPGLAYDLLSPIHFLRPALQIPYCHHEKWDGTGYPLGLRGEQIPLSARIFAVVDVWDALRSDRPYRKGWPEKKARDYIRSNSGIHFDPRVVQVFLGLG